ncbi:cyanate lyase [Phaffia rhodozyma]|uniref:Cyanate hydratase n=1 Tax=Phaffia rhodozyma TaxID=264483 RepID=A0A0F7SQQ2_PHARH|nr:cyanate lyase [Phaffia rhodozyma]
MSLNNLSEISKILLAAKAESKLTFEQIASRMDRSEVFVAAIFYGQAKPSEEDLKKLGLVLGGHVASALMKPVTGMGEGYFPSRGDLWSSPPKDPMLYRLYEIMVVYGYPLKHVINEKFGDGIISAVDFHAEVEREQDPKGDRVKITLNGKFLPHAKF